MDHSFALSKRLEKSNQYARHGIGALPKYQSLGTVFAAANTRDADCIFDPCRYGSSPRESTSGMTVMEKSCD
jgi:hypothetical protein